MNPFKPQGTRRKPTGKPKPRHRRPGLVQSLAFALIALTFTALTN